MTYPMRPKEFRQALDRLSLTQAEAGLLLGGKSDRTGRRWAEQGAPLAVALVLALMDQHKLTKQHLKTIGRKYRQRLNAG